MRQIQNVRTTLLSAALAMPLSFAVVSFGDDNPMGSPQATPPASTPGTPAQGQGAAPADSGSADKGVLSGPKVPDGAQGRGPAFGGGARGERGGMQEGPGQAVRRAMAEERVFMMTIREMMDGLSDEQRSKIESIRKDFEAQRKAWREKNGEQLREIEEGMRAMREDGGKPDPALVEKGEALRKTMPDSKAMQANVFAVLTPDQQAAFKEAFTANQKRAQERQRQGGPRGRGPGGPDAGAPDGQGGPMGPGGGRGRGGRGPRGGGQGNGDQPPAKKAPPGAEPPQDRNYEFDTPR
jgi:Spy/CpxP family protein refolding chaperone